MAEDFLAQFIDNANKAKLIRAFVLNQNMPLSIADAAKRSGLSSKVAEQGIQMLAKTCLIKPVAKNKDDQWAFNVQHRHATAVSRFIHEISPPRYDNVVSVLRGAGRPTAVVLSGCFVGDLTRPADILVAADTFNELRLEKAVRTLEPDAGHEIRYAAFTTPEFRYRLTIQDRLIRDTLDYPHLVLLDRTRLL